MSVVPPVIICESGDVQFYASLEDAELDLEAIDVNNEEYVGYDSEGRLLRLFVAQSYPERGCLLRFLFPTIVVERVVIDAAEDQPNHASQLRNRLGEFFARLRDDPALESADLSTLVQIGVDSLQR